MASTSYATTSAAPCTSASLAKASECSTCLEPFDTKQRLRVSCHLCQVPVCWECISSFMRSNAVMPSCSTPGCNQDFDEAYLFRQLPKKMVTTVRAFVRGVLLDRAKSRFPEVLAKIQQQGSVHTEPRRRLNPEYQLVRRRLKDISLDQRKFQEIRSWLAGCLARIWTLTADGLYVNEKHKIRIHPTNLRTALDRTETKIQRLHVEYYEISHALAILPQYLWYDYQGQPLDAPPPTEDAPKKTQERQAFVFPCGRAGCEGFLSTHWKCLICRLDRCKDCHLHKEEEGHQCRPDDVASAKEVMKDSRPCPKCGIRISRTHGCDHMFCIECKTAFSYKTGKITANSTNPHYYEWRLKQGLTDPVPAAPVGDCVDPLEAINTSLLSRRLYALGFSTKLVAKAWDFRDLIDPHNRNGIALSQRLEDADLDLCERFLLGLIKEKEFKEQLFRSYRKAQRQNHHADLISTLRLAGGEILRGVVNAPDPAEARRQVEAIDPLVAYINSCFRSLNESLLYDTCPHIDRYFKLHRSVYYKATHPVAAMPRIHFELKDIKKAVRNSLASQIGDIDAQLTYLMTLPTAVPQFGLPAAPVVWTVAGPIMPPVAGEADSDDDYRR